jgi:uncharacterized protein DUF4232
VRDLDELLRDSLHTEAESYRPSDGDPGREFMRRYRRRRSMNSIAVGLFAIAALSGVAIGARALTGQHSLISPDASSSALPSTRTPTAPPPLASWPACKSSDLSAKFVAGNGAAGHIAEVIAFANHSSAGCTLQGRPALQLVRPSEQHLKSTQEPNTYVPDNGYERVALQPGVPLPSGETADQPGLAVLTFEWRDCNQQDIVEFVDVQLPNGGGTVRVRAPSGGLDRSGQGYCTGSGPSGSTLAVNNFMSVGRHS